MNARRTTRLHQPTPPSPPAPSLTLDSCPILSVSCDHLTAPCRLSAPSVICCPASIKFRRSSWRGVLSRARAPARPMQVPVVHMKAYATLGAAVMRPVASRDSEWSESYRTRRWRACLDSTARRRSESLAEGCVASACPVCRVLVWDLWTRRLTRVPCSVLTARGGRSPGVTAISCSCSCLSCYSCSAPGGGHVRRNRTEGSSLRLISHSSGAHLASGAVFHWTSAPIMVSRKPAAAFPSWSRPRPRPLARC